MAQLLDGVLRPLGLVTQPNKFGYYEPGALRVARGVNIRDPAVITRQLVFTQRYAGPWAGLGATAFILIPVGEIIAGTSYYVLYLNGDAIWRWSSDNTLVGSITHSMFGGTNTVEAFQVGTGRKRTFGWAANGQRLAVPSVSCMNVWDVPSGATGVRPGGLPQPSISFSNTLVAATGGVLPAGKHVHYVCVVRRVFSDNVELVSAPSAAFYIRNATASDANPELQLVIGSRGKQNDYVDLYKTRVQTSTVNTGADYYLCASVKLTTNGPQSYLVKDTCNDQNTGAALYTNSGVRGAAAANMPPPLAKNVFTFKGYTFYIGVTELPSITLRVGSGIFFSVDGTAALAQYRQFGIGSRAVVGTVASGGNQITAVSAADIVGIVIGQRLTSGPVGFAGTLTVSAVGATTITFSGGTFSANNVGGTWKVTDVIEVNGVITQVDSVNTLLDLGSNVFGVASMDFASVQCLDRVLLPSALATFNVNNQTTPADSFTIYKPYSTANTASVAPMTIRATNGANYTPPLPRIELAESALSIANVVRKNMIRWSEQNNCDACPASNYGFCGTAENYMGYPMRDSALIFASDGCWRLSGTGGQAGAGYDWRIDPIDSTLILSGPRCGCVARDTWYGYTNRGFVSVDSSGTVREISQGRVQNLMAGPTWDNNQDVVVFFDEANDEITIKPEAVSNWYTYNLLTDSFTEMDVNAVGSPFDGSFSRVFQRVALVSDTGVFEPSIAVSCTNADVQYQPTYGDNPFAIQQWQSMDLVFDAPSVGLNVFPNLNQVGGSSSRALVQRGNDQARTTFGVGRNTPSKATCIAPGFAILGQSTVQARFFGLALRKVPITIQREKR